MPLNKETKPHTHTHTYILYVKFKIFFIFLFLHVLYHQKLHKEWQFGENG